MIAILAVLAVIAVGVATDVPTHPDDAVQNSAVTITHANSGHGGAE